MNFIEARKLVHEYIRRDEEGNVEGIDTALDGVDLDIKQGEFIAVLGHNGSGKSTLAKHLNVLLQSSGGTLWVDGKDTTDEANVWDIRKNAGMVFQNPDNQIIASVVEEDVAFGPENIGIPTDEIWKRVENSLKSVGMIQYREHSPNKLSGGQKQRIAAARALILNPELILADEPTGALDSKNAKSLMEKLLELNVMREATIMMVTHDANAASYCSRILFIQDGVIFHELRREREEETRTQYYERIIDVLAQLGGGSVNVF